LNVPENNQDEEEITSALNDTILDKSNIILLGPTGCGVHLNSKIIIIYDNF